MNPESVSTHRPWSEALDRQEQIRLRDQRIGIAIDRLKSEIAQVARQQGFDALSLSIEWPDGVANPDSLPDVHVEGRLSC